MDAQRIFEPTPGPRRRRGRRLHRRPHDQGRRRDAVLQGQGGTPARGRARLRDDPALRLRLPPVRHRRRLAQDRTASSASTTCTRTRNARASWSRPSCRATARGARRWRTLWTTADWHEREQFDLLGVVFDGPPRSAPPAAARRLGRAPDAQGLQGSRRVPRHADHPAQRRSSCSRLRQGAARRKPAVRRDERTRLRLRDPARR